jgi:hypothetical protein
VPTIASADLGWAQARTSILVPKGLRVIVERRAGLLDMAISRSAPATVSKRKKGRISAALFVELPGIETDALPGNLGSELPVRSISVEFGPARYLRLCFRVLTASRANQWSLSFHSCLEAVDRRSASLWVLCEPPVDAGCSLTAPGRYRWSVLLSRQEVSRSLLRIRIAGNGPPKSSSR